MITFTFPYLDQRVFMTTIVVLICFSPNRHSIAPMPQTPKAFQFPSESGTVKAPFFIGIFATLTLCSNSSSAATCLEYYYY